MRVPGFVRRCILIGTIRVIRTRFDVRDDP